jgi:lambda family phage portal protein
MNPFQNAARQMDAPRVQRNAFGGAAQNRLYRDWRAPSLSPDTEAKNVRPLLRARARQLVQDNSYAEGFVSEVQNNVIGPTGIKLRAMISTRIGDAHSTTNKAIEDGWKEWGNPENASADGHDSWLDLEKLCARTLAVDGECFIRHRRYFDNPFGYAIQLIDADQVDDYYNVTAEAGRNEIRSGIELNENGKAIAYHVWSRHPSDMGKRVRERIDASEILHLFIRRRTGQTRGITWFAPVLTNLKTHDSYTEAELVAARIGASKMGFYVTKEGMGLGPNPDEEDERLMEVAPGQFDELPPGMEVQTFDPQHPNAAFKDFTKAILRGIARGLGVSYTALTGDLEGVNYSSIRWGMLAERDNWRSLQGWLSVQLHRRVYREWVAQALLNNALSVDSRVAANFHNVMWKPRGWAWVDPLKDLQASALGVELGVDDRTSILDQEGESLEETFQNLAREKELAEKLGITITPAKGSPAQASDDEQDDEPEKKKPALKVS